MSKDLHTDVHSNVICNRQKWKQPKSPSMLNEYRNCVESIQWNTTYNKKEQTI